jgi:hypothetical protein
MTPKQLYFYLLSILLALALVLAGLYLLKRQQNELRSAQTLVDFYHGLSQELITSSKTLDGNQLSDWLANNNNEQLLNAIGDKEYFYCPNANATSFIVARVKNSLWFKSGNNECYSTSRGKILINLDCQRALVCLGER